MQKLSLHEPKFNGKELKYLNDCINSSWVSTYGKHIAKFEKKISMDTKSKYAISSNSGTLISQISLLVAGVK